jgi:hypothetical protein
VKNYSSSFCVQIGSEAHPPFCPKVSQVLPRGISGRGVTLTTHLHLMPRSRMSRSYTSSPHLPLRGVLHCFTLPMCVCVRACACAYLCDRSLTFKILCLKMT